ncbi:MAG: response regulator [Bacteroidetes bacterium]|nr:response regulator [Bacteroidota bacterium]
MKILIIEDEALVAKELSTQLSDCLPEAEILAVIDSVEGGREWLNKHSLPDLIFSDIQLADGTSFEIFENFDLHTPVIFTTAYDEYALRAFKLNSIDYLLKPIRQEDLCRSIDKFKSLRERSSPEFIQAQFAHLFQDLRAGKKYKSRFAAHQGQSMVPVPMEKLSGFVKDEIIFLLTKSGEKLITDYHTLDELEELLDPKLFYRANRQYIVQIEAILGFKPHYTGKLILQLEGHKDEVVVSREKAASFKRWFEEED